MKIYEALGWKGFYRGIFLLKNTTINNIMYTGALAKLSFGVI
jgi:hypothetical protein